MDGVKEFLDGRSFLVRQPPRSDGVNDLGVGSSGDCREVISSENGIEVPFGRSRVVCRCVLGQDCFDERFHDVSHATTGGRLELFGRGIVSIGLYIGKLAVEQTDDIS